jgi:acyl-CoA thioester hydrolase
MTLEPDALLETALAFTVKPYDIDITGFVSQMILMRWIEDLRLDLFQQYFSLEQQLELGISPLIGKTRLEYHKPIKLFDLIEGRMWFSDMGSVKWIVKTELIVDDKIAATAKQTGCFIHVSSHRLVAIPDNLVKKFATHSSS